MRSRFVPRSATLLLAVCLAAPALAQRPTGARVQVASQGDSGVVSARPAAESSTLRRPITLKLGDAPLDRALEEIARRAGLTLGYPADLLPAERRVTIELSGAPAGEAFARVLHGTGLEVRELRGGQLVLVRRAGDERTAVGALGTIAGRVTDAETGAGLAGARVRLAGSNFATLTGGDGAYRISGVTPGTYRVTATLIGYSEGTQRLTIAADEIVNVDLALSVSAVPLDQVVVTGSVVPTEVRAIPTPISVVTSRDIEKRGIQRVDQLFRGAIPGIVAPDMGTFDYFSELRIRGLSTLGTRPAIKIYIDGIEMADFAYLANLDPNIIERMEVIRGPQAAAIYGSGALDGVIQIFTKRGQSDSVEPVVRGRLSLGAISRPFEDGVAALQDHHVQVDGGQTGLRYTVGASRLTQGEWVPEYGSSTTSFNVAGRLIHGSLSVDISTRYTDRSFASRWDVLSRDAGYLPFSRPPLERNEIRQQTYGATLTYSTSPRLQHQLTVGYDGNEFDLYNTEPRRTTPADTLMNLYSGHWGRQSIRYMSSLDVPFSDVVSSQLVVGADHYSLNHSQFSSLRVSRTEGSIDGLSYPTRGPSQNTGAFAQVQSNMADALFLTLGLRLDRNSAFGTDFGSNVSPRAGISYLIDRGPVTAKLRGSYGVAIRPPPVEAQQSVVTTSVVRVPNLNIAPERQGGWDAGVELYAGNHSSVSLTYYDQTVDGLVQNVVLDGSSAPQRIQSQNVGRIGNRGWEVESVVNPTGSTSIEASYTRMTSVVERLSPGYNGDLRIGDQLLGVPAYSAGASLTQSIGRTTASAEITHVGPWTHRDVRAQFAFFYGGAEYRGSQRAYWMEYPAFTKYNLAVSQLLRDRLAAFVRLDNVMNDRSYERMNTDEPMGRRITVGLRLNQ